MTDRTRVIQATDIDKGYEGASGWVHALHDLNLEIYENEFFCMLGPSGCGKSTFLKIVSGLLSPSSGQVLLNGGAIEGPGPDRGIVFQEPALFPWLNVLQNVEFGLSMAHQPKHERHQRAREVLKIVGLANYERLYPYQLSGGMKHRVAVARAWAVKDAALLLMDEPFSAVDAINRMTLQDHLVETWQREKRTVLYVTHDIEEAVYLADRICILTPSPGKVADILTVALPRPRGRNSPEVAALKSRVIDVMQLSADKTKAALAG